MTFVENVLTGHRTRLNFYDFTLDWFTLDNGIRQGDPLSMILCLYYNADVLDIARGRDEMVLGYVDDIAVVAAAKTFEQAHSAINDMMIRAGGAFNWSEAHNSSFETSKSVLMDFTWSRTAMCMPMQVKGTTLSPQPTHRFLGVLMDQELWWGHQASHAVTKP